MNGIETRVARCFTNVFPGLLPEAISGASTSSLAAWDSVAHIRLLSSVAEEFGLELEMEDFDQLVSYPLILGYVESRCSSGS
jgi:acyl carrier protein